MKSHWSDLTVVCFRTMQFNNSSVWALLSIGVCGVEGEG